MEGAAVKTEKAEKRIGFLPTTSDDWRAEHAPKKNTKNYCPSGKEHCFKLPGSLSPTIYTYI